MSVDLITSPRLAELLRMRGFIDAEIRAERQRLVGDSAPALIQAAADLYGSTAEDVRTSANDRGAVRARMLACWMLRESGKSFPEIGRALGIHHTTAMHACRSVGGDPARLALARRLMAQEAAA